MSTFCVGGTIDIMVIIVGTGIGQIVTYNDCEPITNYDIHYHCTQQFDLFHS